MPSADRIECGAPVDSMTLRAADLTLPLRTVDPVLAQILHRHADSLATSRLDEPSWTERVQQELAQHNGRGPSHEIVWHTGSVTPMRGHCAVRPGAGIPSRCRTSGQLRGLSWIRRTRNQVAADRYRRGQHCGQLFLVSEPEVIMNGML